MANIWSSVDCCEVQNTRSETFTRNGLEASVTLQCDYADRHALAADIVGLRKPFPLTSYTLPPLAVGAAIRFGNERAENSNGELVYQDALVTITYSNDEEEDLVSESLEPTAEFITLDFRRFRWGSVTGAPVLEGEAPGKQFKGMNLVRTHFNIEPPLPGVLLTAMGGVNDAIYTSSLLGLAFDEETLLYQPPALSRTITTAGDRAFDITLKFSYKPEGWNKYYRAATGIWERMYLTPSLGAAGGVWNSYPLKDFSSLLF